MISFRKPTADTVRSFLESQSTLSFSYAAVGATAGAPPPGCSVDHHRTHLGSGKSVFEAAKAALARFDHYRLGWMDVWPEPGPVRAGSVVAVAARSLGSWWLNACRIVYVVDNVVGTKSVFGFAYGTLPGHAETGEERFLVEWDRDDDSVWFDIFAFSRPRHLLARLGTPWVRGLQRRFGRESMAAMVAVARAKAIGNR